MALTVFGRIVTRCALLAAVFSATNSLAAGPTNGTWINISSGGLWSTPGNWSGGNVATNTDAIADFSTLNISADNTVHLDSTRSVGTLLFGDTTPSNAWILDNNANVSNLLVLAVSSGTPSINVSTGNSAIISAFVAGSQGFNKNGLGSLTLSGNNNYLGTTTINTGTLVLANGNALGNTSGGTTVVSGASLDLAAQTVGAEALTLSGTGVGGNGALLNSNITPASISGSINSATSGGFSVGGPGAITLSGGFNTTSGSSALTKTGIGTLSLTGTTDNTGLQIVVNTGSVLLAKTSSTTVHAVGAAGLTIAGGTAQLGGTGGDQINDAATVLLTGGAFDTGGLNETFAALSFQGGALQDSTTGNSFLTVATTTLAVNTTISVNNVLSTLAFNSVVAGGGTMIKAGPGLLVLEGNNTFTGGLIINAGYVTLGTPSALNSTTPNTVTFGPNSTGVLSLFGTNATISNLATNFFVGSPVIQNDGGEPVTLTLNNSSSSTYAGVLQDGAGIPLSIIKTGPASLTLAGNNTYTGTTEVSAGTLIITRTTALGSPFGITTIDGTGTLDLSAQSIAEPLNLAGTSTLTNSSADPATISGSVASLSSSPIINGTGNITLAGSVTGNITKSGANTLTLGGITDNAALSLEFLSGTLLLAKTSSLSVHALPYVFIQGGLVQLAGSGDDQINDNGFISLTSGSFDSNGRNETLASLIIQGTSANGTLLNSDSASSVLTLSGTTLTGDTSIGVTHPAASLTLNSAISGNHALTKVGAGTVILSGNSTFAGPLTISAGTLTQNGDLAASVINNASFIYNAGAFAGRLTNIGNAAFNADFTAANGMENDAAISIPAGRTITLSGAGLDNAGSLTLNGGALLLSATATNLNRGTFSLNSGGSFNLNGNLTNTGLINLNGSLIFGTATLANNPGGDISGIGTIQAPFANSGGLLSVPAGGLNVLQNFTNSGTIQLTSVASVLNGGALANTGSIQGLGNIANAITNAPNATIEALGGTLFLGGTFKNQSGGLLTTGLNTKILVSSGLDTNAGTISLTGGTFDNNGHPLNNTGSITGFGILRTGAAGLDNNGSITFSGGLTTINGPVTNESGKTINIRFNPAIFTGFVTNLGTIKTTSTTVTYAAGCSVGGTYTSDPSTNIFSDLTVTPTGVVTGGVGDVFSITSGTLTNYGTFSSGGTLTAGIVVNNGTLNLGGTANVSAITGNATTASHYTGIINVTANGTLTSDYIRQDTLATAGKVTLNESTGTLASGWPGGDNAKVSIIKTLDLKAGGLSFVGTIDVTNNDLIVDYTGSSDPYATIEAAIRSGYNHGTWTGPGITSSDAAARNIFTLLALDSANINLGSSFDGVTLGSSTVIVKFTHMDDLNGDGVVTAADTAIFKANYNLYHDSNNPITHAMGDMDYDGLMTFNDAQLFSLYYNTGLAHLPEPGAMAIFVMGAVSLLVRRRQV